MDDEHELITGEIDLDGHGVRAFAEIGEFLQGQPPGTQVVVVMETRKISGGTQSKIALPELQLHCASERCGGLRVFSTATPAIYCKFKNDEVLLSYSCRNCGGSSRTFSLLTRALDFDRAMVTKVGEFPPFGPPVSPRVISLLLPDRELFLNGRRAENMGLGIGAIAYYRRVVERQWLRIVDEIVRAAERTGASPPALELLRSARSKAQYKSAMERIDPAIPESLRIDGHSPLGLLERALGESLNDLDDEECRALASSVRVVLTELAERLGSALKDEKELQDALGTLLNRKRPRLPLRPARD